MNYPADINITASVTPEQASILTPEALSKKIEMSYSAVKN